jgi:hypothetical protein
VTLSGWLVLSGKKNQRRRHDGAAERKQKCPTPSHSGSLAGNGWEGKPLATYVERPFEATKAEAYRALFSVQEVNVAVYLGKASGGFARLILISKRTWQDFWQLIPGWRTRFSREWIRVVRSRRQGKFSAFQRMAFRMRVAPLG